MLIFRYSRSYVDSRLQMPFSINFDRPFFERGNYAATAFNGSTEIVIENPWEGSGSNSAPFDKRTLHLSEFATNY